MKNRTLLSLCILAGTSAIAVSSSHADALNEKRILNKAGGESDGKIKNVIVATSYVNGDGTVSDPIFESSFDREGSVKIPKKDGDTKTVVEHGGPEKGFDGIADGDVKKAKVKRNGKTIVYKAVGKLEPVALETAAAPEPDPTMLDGVAKATSKIRNTKVVTTGGSFGTRAIYGGTALQEVTVEVRGIGKY
jgi:hypothetical protein